jgi:hypothetical protein
MKYSTVMCVEMNAERNKVYFRLVVRMDGEIYLSSLSIYIK